jgi:hypothetical protein
MSHEAPAVLKAAHKRPQGKPLSPGLTHFGSVQHLKARSSQGFFLVTFSTVQAWCSMCEQSKGLMPIKLC